MEHFIHPIHPFVCPSVHDSALVNSVLYLNKLWMGTDEVFMQINIGQGIFFWKIVVGGQYHSEADSVSQKIMN